jgi:single-stranded DNA-binding protein
MSLNSVALCGRVTDAGVKLTYLPSGHPEAKFTVLLEEAGGKDGQQTFRLFVPVVIYGSRAEILAETLEPGDLVSLVGKLGWRTLPATKADPKPTGKLTVVAWQIERLAGATAPAPVGERVDEGAQRAIP